MKISKKLLILLMTCAIGTAVFTGCNNSKDQTVVEEKQDKDTTEKDNLEADNNEETTDNDQATDESQQLDSVAGKAYTTITEGVELPSMSMSADDALVADSYGIDTNILASYHVEMGTNRALVSEIAVFELKDAKDLETLKAGIEKRQADLDKQWDRYFDEHEIVKDSRTVVKDNMVLYVVSDQADKIVENFNAM